MTDPYPIFDYLTLTQLGSVFGVSATASGSWLAELGLRRITGVPAQKAIDAGLEVRRGPVRPGPGRGQVPARSQAAYSLTSPPAARRRSCARESAIHWPDAAGVLPHQGRLDHQDHPGRAGPLSTSDGSLCSRWWRAWRRQPRCRTRPVRENEATLLTPTKAQAPPPAAPFQKRGQLFSFQFNSIGRRHC